MNPIDIIFEQQKDNMSHSVQKYPEEDAFPDSLKDTILSIDSASIRKSSNHVQEKTLPTTLMKQDLCFCPIHMLFFVLQAFCLWHGELPLRIWVK